MKYQKFRSPHTHDSLDFVAAYIRYFYVFILYVRVSSSYIMSQEIEVIQSVMDVLCCVAF